MRKQVAREIIELRIEMRDVLLKHDAPAFRDLILSRGKELASPWLVAFVRDLDEPQLSELLHSVKCMQPYLGEAFQESRNYFRFKSLQEQLREPGVHNPELEAQKTVPPCITCKFYREAPEGETHSCMSLGTSPYDLCCAGWSRLVEEPVAVCDPQ